jgi:hypothetical protein
VTEVELENLELIMKNKVSTIALLLTLSASLAFAGEKNKSAGSSDDSQPAATAAGEQSPCATSQPQKKEKNHNQQEPTDQEKQFDRVLMGIYG